MHNCIHGSLNVLCFAVVFYIVQRKPCVLRYIMAWTKTPVSGGPVIYSILQEYIEAILLQLNPSNNYYTNGDDDVLFIKIGSNKVLLLDYTYHINRTIFQNCTKFRIY